MLEIVSKYILEGQKPQYLSSFQERINKIILKFFILILESPHKFDPKTLKTSRKLPLKRCPFNVHFQIIHYIMLAAFIYK